jgi:hypothetical protein
MLSFPRPASQQDLNLDKSWEQDLAYLYRHHAQAGKDYLFAYGPLGVFYTQFYSPDLYWPKYAWEVLLKLALASIAAIAVGRMPGIGMKVSYCLLFLIFLGENRGDTLFPYLLLAAALLLCNRDQFSWAWPPFLLLLAVLSLVKFSFFVLSALFVSIFVGYFLASRRWKTAALTASIAVLFLFLVWVALGQSIENVPGYLRGSLQLTAGYTAAMAMDGNPWELPLAIAVAVLGIGAVFSFDLRNVPRQRLFAVLLLVAVGLFQQWKSGFVRHDQHSHTFFVYAMLVPFLLPLAFPGDEGRVRLRQALTFACVLLGVVGYQVSTRIPVVDAPFLMGGFTRVRDNLKIALRPLEWKGVLDASRAEYPEGWRLPGIREHVGDGTIDLLTDSQGILFVNDLHYHPRPVLQSSCAYTSFLLNANAVFFESNSAPDFLILAWISIDGRLPSLEDNQAFQVVLRSYDPVLIEKGFLLLRRRSVPAARNEAREKILLNDTMPFGATADIGQFSDRYQTLAVKIRYSLWGRLRSFFYKPTPVFINIETAEMPPTTFRLIPAMAEDGFLINPLVTNQGDIFKLYGASGATRVLSFSITSPELGPSSYEPEIGVVLKARPDLAPTRLPAAEIKKLVGS